MTVYTLYCTTCSANYSTLSNWNEHLVNSLHQRNAKNELWQWDKSVRKCCVVTYSRTNLSKTIIQSVIPYFVTNIINGFSVIITDLILSEERLGTGIIRFENIEKVDDLLSIMTSSSIMIENQLYQFRGLGKFLKLEWEELLVCSFNVELPILTTQPERDSLTKELTEKSIRDDGIAYQTGNISCQVKFILEKMQIPIEEFKFVENVIEEFKKLLKKTLSQNCAVGMYRNNFLKLQNNPASSLYLIFMYMPNEQSTGFTAIDEETRDKIFLKIASYKHKNRKSILSKLDVENECRESISSSKSKTIFSYRNLGIEFRLSTNPATIPSLQLSKLVSYYCQCDPRVKPLLSLAYFWAKINRVLLSKSKVRGRSIHSHQVDPVALEWLMLFFLFHEEQALPVPRLILERSHSTILFSKIDCGFKEDLEFAKNWESERKLGYPSLDSSEESARNLLLLFTKFLKFYSESMKPGRHIINVRDGEILSSESPSEPFVLKDLDKKGRKEKKLGNYLNTVEEEYISNLAKAPFNNMIIMTSPFDFRWRLSIDYDNWFNVVYPKIKRTAEKLDKFIKNIESGHGVSYSLEDVLLCR